MKADTESKVEYKVMRLHALRIEIEMQLTHSRVKMFQLEFQQHHGPTFRIIDNGLEGAHE